MLRAVQGASAETLVVYLISGGASAIAEKPITSNISLPDVVATYKALVHSGAPIAEINAVRKHLSAIKGGRLARAAHTAHQLSVLVSDVPENSLDALASGPTMPDSTTVDECYVIAKRYALLPHFPPPVHGLFQQHLLQETPKAGDPSFSRSQYSTVLSNSTAVGAVVERAALGGFAVEVDNSCDDWDYREAADHLLRRLKELATRRVARLPNLEWRGVREDRWACPALAAATSNLRFIVLRRLPERRSPWAQRRHRWRGWQQSGRGRCRRWLNPAPCQRAWL